MEYGFKVTTNAQGNLHNLIGDPDACPELYTTMIELRSTTKLLGVPTHRHLLSRPSRLIARRRPTGEEARELGELWRGLVSGDTKTRGRVRERGDGVEEVQEDARGLGEGGGHFLPCHAPPLLTKPRVADPPPCCRSAPWGALSSGRPGTRSTVACGAGATRTVGLRGKRGARLSLGPYLTAEAAAHANDAAMLALGGRSARCLNFADSVWLLVVSSVLSDRADVRRAALQADGRREGPSSAPAQLSSESDNADSSETSEPSADGEFKLPVATDSDMFRLDIFPEMDLGSYYLSLAEALLVDTPSTATIIDTYRDNGDGGADVPLWSY
uniref:CRT/DRE binding factor 8C n=1 Tax=Hordeum vulgare subsp. vulgare TaxID=112509 RepID=C1IJB8_HORVV|nr:CRT/DRE binding factor 8C [Hordeum vulgare subsp. vulgare]